MHYVDGLSVKEIADSTGKPVGDDYEAVVAGDW